MTLRSTCLCTCTWNSNSDIAFFRVVSLKYYPRICSFFVRIVKTWKNPSRHPTCVPHTLRFIFNCCPSIISHVMYLRKQHIFMYRNKRFLCYIKTERSFPVSCKTIFYSWKWTLWVRYLIISILDEITYKLSKIV